MSDDSGSESSSEEDLESSDESYCPSPDEENNSSRNSEEEEDSAGKNDTLCEEEENLPETRKEPTDANDSGEEKESAEMNNSCGSENGEKPADKNSSESLSEEVTDGRPRCVVCKKGIAGTKYFGVDSICRACRIFYYRAIRFNDIPKKCTKKFSFKCTVRDLGYGYCAYCRFQRFKGLEIENYKIGVRRRDQNLQTKMINKLKEFMASDLERLEDCNRFKYFSKEISCLSTGSLQRASKLS